MKFGLFAFLMLVPAIFAPGPPPFNCGDYNVSLQSVTQLPSGKYNWSYTVCHSKDYYGISHWVLETCICSEYNGEVGRCIYSYGSNLAGWSRDLDYGADPTTGITGLKFDELPAFRGCKTFWFVVNNDYDPISTIGGIKAATGKCNYTVTGPAHTPVSAPEFPSIAVPLIVTAGAATFVYALRKTS